MSLGHLHLLLNHIPLFGILFGLLLLIIGIIRKNDEIKKISFYTFIISAMITIPTYLTGSKAEGLLENIPTVTETVIKPHEEMGEIALIFTSILGILSLGILFIKLSEKTKKIVFSGILILSVISLSLIIRTAYLGGQIRHTELRPNQAHVEIIKSESAR